MLRDGGTNDAAPGAPPTAPATTGPPDTPAPSAADSSTTTGVSPTTATPSTTTPSAPSVAPTVGPGESPGEILLEPAALPGPDPYTGEIFAAPVDLPAAVGIVPTLLGAEGPTAEVQGRSGDAPGLYGGTRDDARCDPGGIVAYLASRPDKAGAWIAALNADPRAVRPDAPGPLTLNDLPDYLAGLTPVLLTEDTRVTNHGYRNGAPTPRQSVLQAGTAVLIDAWGVPRVRCACGNPLLGPVPAPTEPDYLGPSWEGRDSRITVYVEPAPEAVDSFTLTDAYTGETFSRPAGTDGSADASEPAPAAVTAVAGPGPFPPTSGVEIGAAYDTATFTVYIDPATTDWIAFSGADRLVDQPAGGADPVPDGIEDLIFPDVDDFLVVVATVNGIDSGPYVLHDRDAVGTPIGDQAVVYGYHPSVWYVSRIDWSADPVISYTATGPEEGDMTSFIDAQGAGEYRFEVTFYNQWTWWVAHGPLYLLVGSSGS
jgi:hypothetical protein